MDRGHTWLARPLDPLRLAGQADPTRSRSTTFFRNGAPVGREIGAKSQASRNREAPASARLYLGQRPGDTVPGCGHTTPFQEQPPRRFQAHVHKEG